MNVNDSRRKTENAKELMVLRKFGSWEEYRRKIESQIYLMRNNMGYEEKKRRQLMAEEDHFIFLWLIEHDEFNKEEIQMLSKEVLCERIKAIQRRIEEAKFFYIEKYREILKKREEVKFLTLEALFLASKRAEYGTSYLGEKFLMPMREDWSKVDEFIRGFKKKFFDKYGSANVPPFDYFGLVPNWQVPAKDRELYDFEIKKCLARQQFYRQNGLPVELNLMIEERVLTSYGNYHRELQKVFLDKDEKHVYAKMWKLVNKELIKLETEKEECLKRLKDLEIQEYLDQEITDFQKKLAQEKQTIQCQIQEPIKKQNWFKQFLPAKSSRGFFLPLPIFI